MADCDVSVYEARHLSGELTSSSSEMTRNTTCFGSIAAGCAMYRARVQTGCSSWAPPPARASTASAIFFCAAASSASDIVGWISAIGGGRVNVQVPVALIGVVGSVVGHVVLAPLPSVHDSWYSVTGCA